MFHKEGYKILLWLALILLIVNVLVQYIISIGWLQQIILIFSIVLFILILQFFRNPKRLTKVSDLHVVAPVDGKVVAIEEVFEKEYFNDIRLQVSFFMSPLNVHVTRFPVNGKIIYSKYHPGKFLVAWHPKSSELNEHTSVVLNNKNLGDVLYKQIAGALAKRIVNYAKVGDTATQGEDSGFIKFGSRVDVFLPKNTPLDIVLNQHVKGGLSIITKM